MHIVCVCVCVCVCFKAELRKVKEKKLRGPLHILHSSNLSNLRCSYAPISQMHWKENLDCVSLGGHGVEGWRMLKKLFRGQQPVFDSAVNSLSLGLVQFSCSVVSDSLRPHESQHTRPPCPSPTPGIYSDPCPLSW